MREKYDAKACKLRWKGMRKSGVNVLLCSKLNVLLYI